MDMMEEANLAMGKAKIAIMVADSITFYSVVCLRLKTEWCESIPTADCNGLTMRFNPTFFLALSPSERVFLILHETLHAAYMHSLRYNDSIDFERFNIAADHVINLQLTDMGFTMPEGGYCDAQYKNMSTEQVYNRIPVGTKQKPELKDILSSPGGKKEEDAVRKQMDSILVSAATQAKMSGDKPGSIPGELEFYISQLLNPVIPWSNILRRYFNKMVKAGHTFRKPNRRYFPDHILPSQYSEALADIAIAVDASGSVRLEDFAKFVAETRSIIKSFKPKNLRFIQFDTRIRKVDVVESVSALSKLKFTGRGGTNTTEVMEWARDNKPNVLLIFTDGYFSTPKPDPKIPVVWVIYDNPGFVAPFGKVIHFTI